MIAAMLKSHGITYRIEGATTYALDVLYHGGRGLTVESWVAIRTVAEARKFLGY